ncbi:hypothetical protein ACM61V_19840 [Sphingomonas sp. TX0543]|uniref:Uncharacterized protein n=1 Tax=Sphingomonas aquatilis TaxID=93063 RepID=A0AAW3TWT2_9SPHN|nr:hypothetical protein [Sphingomonas aquatilis]MBB3877590.1 hypothetical protein [Sphingomonas aquatilis]GEM73883.1 hypothetical protein SAQ01S_36490 [Sphingomonas aquatilis NBRC 16722]
MAKSEKGSKRAERVESDGTALNTSVESSARDQVAEALTKATADSYTCMPRPSGFIGTSRVPASTVCTT